MLESILEVLSNEILWAQFGCQEGLKNGPESGVAHWASGTARKAVLLRMAIFPVFDYVLELYLMANDLNL